ncbi:CUB and sushi domain-containing protein 3-like [Branchiostoma floridae x Branchiostoma japonicum]
MASLWNNGELVGERHIGVAEVASQYPVRVAVRGGDGRYFSGRIACLQLYNYVMTQEQIVAARDVCKVCADPLGMESGAIPDDSITASSYWDTDHEPYRGRLNGVDGVGAWAALTNTIGEWLQVDLGEINRVTGTIIQGRDDHYNQWVTSYKLQYSIDGISLTTYAGNDGPEKVFPGNDDRSTTVTNLLDTPVDARYVRFLPQSWHGHMSMRVEILGCGINSVRLPQDPSWVVDSAGTPWVDNGVTYDAAKALDGDTGTYWNPQDTSQYYKNWYIDMDLTVPQTLTRIAVNNYGDTTHDIAEFTLQKSQVGSPYSWEDVVSVDNVQGGTNQSQEFGGFQGTARYWRFIITRTHSGYQPYLTELNLYGISSGACPELPHPDNGSRTEGHLYGDKVTFSCHDGYELIGSENRTCQANQSWSGTQPNCSTTNAVVGLWPLNGHYGASDISGNGNNGTATGTQLAPGPYGDADGAFLFSGTENSYIDIPNNGMLDVRYSFTILAHIYPTGEAGPIFNYVGSNNDWALHFWQVASQELFMRPVGRNGEFSTGITSNVLQQNAWNYVGTTYNSATGNASLWNNSELAGERHIGVAEVASQYPVRVAVRGGDGRYFSGRIACLQLYNYAMTREQTVAARDVCKGTACPELSLPNNGSRTEGRLYGDKVTFSCHEGYELIGPENRTCQANQSWSGTQPNCSRTSCPPLPPVEHGSTSGDSYYGDVITYHCYPGYEISGDEERTCQSDQTWSGTQPTCSRTTCPILPVPNNGSRTEGNLYGDKVTFSCNEGYELIGSENRTCQANQSWSGTQPNCSRTSCPPLAPVEHGSTSGGSYYGDVVTYHCDPGYEISGDEERTCQSDQTWSGTQPTCSRTACPILPVPNNGSRTEGHLYGDKVTFSCHEGYELIGPENRTCQANQSWSGTQPNCCSTYLLSSL